MSSSEVQFSHIRKRPLGQRIRETVYQKESGTIFGRTCGSWAQITLFYAIFYICLASFFVVSMLIFYRTLNDESPKLYGYDTPMKNNPGMGFRPQPSPESSTIKFEQGVEKSYKKYTDDIAKFLEAYAAENQTGGNFANCSDDEDVDHTKACTFDVSEITTKCVPPHFGYNEGQPCVLLKLNKVIGWIPTNDSGDSSTPVQSVSITCQGHRDADKRLLGEVEIFPSSGLPAYYFPYRHQQDYLQPIVFARFPRVTNEETVEVWCKAEASNIFLHRNDKAGSVLFSLRIN